MGESYRPLGQVCSREVSQRFRLRREQMPYYSTWSRVLDQRSLAIGDHLSDRLPNYWQKLWMNYIGTYTLMPLSACTLQWVLTAFFSTTTVVALLLTTLFPLFEQISWSAFTVRFRFQLSRQRYLGQLSMSPGHFCSSRWIVWSAFWRLSIMLIVSMGFTTPSRSSSLTASFSRFISCTRCACR